MKTLMIAWKDLLIRLRDRKGLLLMILMPLLLTSILGAALGKAMSGEGTSMPTMTIAIYSGDQGELGTKLTNDVLQSEELKPYIKIKSYTSHDEVAKQIESGKEDVGIVVPEHFSEDILAGKVTSVAIIQDPGKPISAQIIQSIVNSYTNRVSTVALASSTVINELAISASTSQLPIDLQSIVQDVSNQLKEVATKTNAQVVDTPVGKAPVSGMQYYAAAMAAMFLLFNATVGAKSILNERSTVTLARMMSTPTHKGSILVGKFLGTLAFSIVQFLLFMTVTHFLFGVNWGENYTQSIVIGVFYAFAVSGLSMLVAAMVANEQAADIISGIGVQILSALGGSMVPIALFPKLLQKIAYITPNSWALRGFVDIMTGTSWQALLLPITVLLSIGLVSLLIGTLRLRLR